MKNLFIILIAFSFIPLTAVGQKNPPEKVKREFAVKYASAQSVKWENEEKNEWEAEFILSGKLTSASFDNDGKWIESETRISNNEIPSGVLNTLKKDFQDYKKGNIELFENSKMKGYETTLINGEKSLEVIFDASGKIISQTIEKYSK